MKVVRKSVNSNTIIKNNANALHAKFIHIFRLIFFDNSHNDIIY